MDRHPVQVRTQVVFYDEVGYAWCSSCRNRGLLLNWAKYHGWPDVQAGLYAVGGDEQLWRVPMTMGSDALVEAVRLTVFSDGQEEEVA